MRINENIILNVDNTLISNIFFLMYIKYIWAQIIIDYNKKRQKSWAIGEF